MKPEELKYSEEHVWVAITGQEARIGITDHAQKELEEVVFVELPETGKKLKQGDVFATIESVKSVSDLPAPLTGEVLEVNSPLTKKPDLVNESPYERGWLIRMTMENPAELESLMDLTAYNRHIQ